MKTALKKCFVACLEEFDVCTSILKWYKFLCVLGIQHFAFKTSPWGVLPNKLSWYASCFKTCQKSNFSGKAAGIPTTVCQTLNSENWLLQVFASMILDRRNWRKNQKWREGVMNVQKCLQNPAHKFIIAYKWFQNYAWGGGGRGVWLNKLSKKICICENMITL